MPEDMPEARGNPVTISMFCNTAFTGDIVTRRLQTGILIFINNAPITWFSKRQNTVEASTFGREFVALRVGCEMLPTNVYCDNQAVVSNSSLAELTLKKKHIFVCYHKVRESYAKGVVRIKYEPTESNLADVCTKVLSAEEKRKKLYHVLY